MVVIWDWKHRSLPLFPWSVSVQFGARFGPEEGEPPCLGPGYKMRWRCRGGLPTGSRGHSILGSYSFSFLSYAVLTMLFWITCWNRGVAVRILLEWGLTLGCCVESKKMEYRDSGLIWVERRWRWRDLASSLEFSAASWNWRSPIEVLLRFELRILVAVSERGRVNLDFRERVLLED